MKQYVFGVNISYHTLTTHYSGAASVIQVVTDTGLRLQLPAIRFRPFFTHTGLQGRFRLRTDDNNAFINLEKL